MNPIVFEHQRLFVLATKDNHYLTTLIKSVQVYYKKGQFPEHYTFATRYLNFKGNIQISRFI